MGSARRLKNLPPREVVFANCIIPISSDVRSLGVIIDSALTFSNHVTRLVNTFFYIQYVFLYSDSIRQEVLDDQLYTRHRPGSHTLQTRPLQRPVVRCSEHTALSIGWCYACGRPAHISTPVLHCLNAASRIRFKLCVLAFQC